MYTNDYSDLDAYTIYYDGEVFVTVYGATMSDTEVDCTMFVGIVPTFIAETYSLASRFRCVL
jgi:hypothetical protein